MAAEVATAMAVMAAIDGSVTARPDQTRPDKLLSSEHTHHLSLCDVSPPLACSRFNHRAVRWMIYHPLVLIRPSQDAQLNNATTHTHTHIRS